MTETKIDVKVEQLPARPGRARSTRTPAPAAGRTTATTSSSASLYVCGQCGHHFRMPSRARIAWLADRGSFVEEAEDVRSADPLALLRPAAIPRAPRRGRAEHRPHRGDRRRRGDARRPSARAGGDGLRLPRRLDGERGRREVRARLRRGDRRRRAAPARLELGRRADAGGDPLADAAAEDGRARSTSSTTPGCRCSACSPHPTTGGVMASFASLGDVTIAEPGALLAFTGPRVVQEIIKEKLPDDFGRSEQNLRFGQIDAIVPRSEQRPYLARLLRLFAAVRPSAGCGSGSSRLKSLPLLHRTGVEGEDERLRSQLESLAARRTRPRTRSGPFVELARHPDRPYTLDYVERMHRRLGRAARRPRPRRRRRDRRRDRHARRPHGRGRRPPEGPRPQGADRAASTGWRTPRATPRRCGVMDAGRALRLPGRDADRHARRLSGRRGRAARPGRGDRPLAGADGLARACRRWPA